MTDEKRHVINARLYEIAKRNGGDLTEDAVIEDAKDPDSPLHDHFEWDVERAAYAYWRIEARKLINGYRVLVTVEERTLSAPVYVLSSEPPRRYVPTNRLAEDKEQARVVLSREIKRVRDAMGRMLAVAAVLGLSDELGQLDLTVSRLEAVAGEE